MLTLFFTAGAVAVVASFIAICGTNMVHSLLSLIVSFIALGVAFFLLGGPFAAVLEVIIYAGAIMVLFLFAIMLCNIKGLCSEEDRILKLKSWFAPVVLASILFVELVYILWFSRDGIYHVAMINPQTVGLKLFGPYMIFVELVSILLLGGLVGAYHIAHRVNRTTADKDAMI